MLTSTVIGVLVIPGLYYLFGRMADKRSLIRDESDEPLSELLQRRAQEPHDRASTRDGDNNNLPLPCETTESPSLLLSEPVFRRSFPLEIPETMAENPSLEIAECTEEKPTVEIPEST
jgi:hypothetical protein